VLFYGVLDTRLTGVELGDVVELFVDPADAEEMVATGTVRSPTRPARSRSWRSR
jgi:hypothetical protein